MKKARKTSENETPEFVKRAERAFKRVAVKVRAEYRRRGMKPAVWPTK